MISRFWRYCFSLCSVCVSYVLLHQDLHIFIFAFFSSSYILSVELFTMFTWDFAILELSWLSSENSFSVQVLRVFDVTAYYFLRILAVGAITAG